MAPSVITLHIISLIISMPAAAATTTTTTTSTSTSTRLRQHPYALPKHHIWHVLGQHVRRGS
jgi:curli biogenesis system outer membrane secretion channel CsgG